MGNPYCADIMTNNSAQHSSSKRFWSLVLSWLNDGIDFVHFTAKNNNFAAVSNTISWSFNDVGVVLFNKFVYNGEISSELLTSSSLPGTSLIGLLFNNVNIDPDGGTDFICSMFGSDFWEIDLYTFDIGIGWVNDSSFELKFGFVEINGGGGGNRFELAAAKCENESNIFEWNAPNCA